MTKEEKEKLLDYIDSQINCVELGEDYLAGENYAYKDVREYVETMEITEPKETNLERYKDELIQWCIHSNRGVNIALGESILDLYRKYTDTRNVYLDDMFKWYLQPYEKPKYKLTKFEYDLLNTYSDCNIECKLTDCKQLRKLKEKGYFNDLYEFAKVHEVLENCEVVE